MLSLAAGAIAGPVIWSFMEYVLHRFSFHEAKGKNYGSREHLRHHGSDETEWVSMFLSWAGVVFVGVVPFRVVGNYLVDTHFGWGIGLGYIAGYFFYEWVHWRAHRNPIRNGYERWIRRHHFIHHFHHPMKNHGVTSTFWDHVFGTYVDVDQVQVPRRLAMRWLTDDDGVVLTQYADDYSIRGARPLDETQQKQDMDDAFANIAPTL